LADAYAAGVDRRDGALIAGVFAPDGVLRRYSDGTGDTLLTEMVGPDIGPTIAERIGRYDLTFHFIGNRRYWTNDDGTAGGEIYCTAHHRTLADGTDYVMYIRYNDTYTRGADGGWRIAVRRLLLDWSETRTIVA
jgi:hypothetical protein